MSLAASSEAVHCGDDGPQFTSLADPEAVAREINAWASADAVNRIKQIGVRTMHPDTHAGLVDAVLRLPWRESESLATAVLGFALEVVSAVPEFSKPAIQALVVTWLPAEPEKGQPKTELPKGTLPKVHETLRGILRVTPLAISHLFAAIKDHLPHRRRELSAHVGFLRELLAMLDYCHALRTRVVHLLVERLVDLDAQITQQLRELEEAADDGDEDAGIFQVESDTSAAELAKMRTNAAKLDTLLSMIMGLIRTTCDERPGSSSGGATLAPSASAAAEASSLAQAGTPPGKKSLVSEDAATDKTAEAASDAAAAAPAPPASDELFSTSGQEPSPFRKGAAALLGGSAGPGKAADGLPCELPLLPPAANSSTSSSREGSADALPMLATGDEKPPTAASLSALLGARTPPPNKAARTLLAASGGGGDASLIAPSPGSSAANNLDAMGDPAEALYDALVSAFRASVLPTYKCRCVQFLLFYATSFDDAFARSFLQLLLAQMRSEHVHSEARVACAGYVASFCSRAKFVGSAHVLAALREMIQWASAYQAGVVLRSHGAPPSLDVGLHGVFYAVMQGVLYILCYRHEQLQTAEGGVALTSLAKTLDGVLKGPLNPLKFTLDAIAGEFERLNVCERLDELLDANEQLVVASRTAAGTPNVLEDFFPFDPLHGFPHCLELIEPHYQEWIHRPNGSSEPRDSNASEAPSRSEDRGASLANSLQGMSVTPCSGDEYGMGEHIRRRLAENRSLVGNLVGGSPFASPLGGYPTFAAASKVPSFGLN